jgi:hypothetical protein
MAANTIVHIVVTECFHLKLAVWGIWTHGTVEITVAPVCGRKLLFLKKQRR